MRLTTYTDYALRVLIFLTLKHKRGERATIPEIAQAYGISRNHLMKVVNNLSQQGFIETVRGRGGGTSLARLPEAITVGEVVRLTEPDFALVECHLEGGEQRCAVWPSCNLNRAFRQALQAFMGALDQVTMADAVTNPTSASSLLGMDLPRTARVVEFMPRA
jgi:Rrf2 family nitric oxide-sensitive transcriptional repressor